LALALKRRDLGEEIVMKEDMGVQEEIDVQEEKQEEFGYRRRGGVSKAEAY
jgi:hypothetical protein